MLSKTLKNKNNKKKSHFIYTTRNQNKQQKRNGRYYEISLFAFRYLQRTTNKRIFS